MNDHALTHNQAIGFLIKNTRLVRICLTHCFQWIFARIPPPAFLFSNSTISKSVDTGNFRHPLESRRFRQLPEENDSACFVLCKRNLSFSDNRKFVNQFVCPVCAAHLVGERAYIGSGEDSSTTKFNLFAFFSGPPNPVVPPAIRTGFPGAARPGISW